MQIIIALIAGTLFGAGLTIAQMVNPQKVLNFFDFAAIPTGGWDPSLLFVFAGALPIMFLAYRIQSRMQKPVFDAAFQIPRRADIDRPLVIGALLFGIGWGMAGLCPGPSIAALPLVGASLNDLLIFVACMLLGMGISLAARSYRAAPSIR